MTQPNTKADAELEKAEKAVIEASQPEQADKENLSVSEDTQQESPEVKEEAQESEPESENLSLGKEYEKLAEKKGFKTPDDLARSYEDLESRTSRVEQMARDALKKVDQAPKESNEQAEALEVLRGVVREELRGAMQPLQEDRNRQQVDKEIQKVREAYPDFEGRIVDDAMQLAASGRAKNLEDAYRILTFDIARGRASEIVQKEEKLTQKKTAFAEPASGAAGSKDIDYDGMTLDELEKVLPKAGDFIDHKGNYRRVR